MPPVPNLGIFSWTGLISGIKTENQRFILNNCSTPDVLIAAHPDAIRTGGLILMPECDGASTMLAFCASRLIEAAWIQAMPGLSKD
jgi:hypothetical protein